MEYYKKQPGCNIQDLDSGAILSILSKAHCFSDAIKVQAAKVKDEVRNKFAHAILKEWTPDRLNQAFSELKALAQLLPDSSALVKELESALTGLGDPDFPMKKFLLKMDKYRNSIIAGKHEKVHERIQKLEPLSDQHSRQMYEHPQLFCLVQLLQVPKCFPYGDQTYASSIVIPFFQDNQAFWFQFHFLSLKSDLSREISFLHFVKYLISILLSLQDILSSKLIYEYFAVVLLSDSLDAAFHQVFLHV